MENHSLNMILGIEGYKYLTAEKVGTIPSIAEQILEMIKEQPSTENSSFNSENYVTNKHDRLCSKGAIGRENFAKNKFSI